MISAEKTGVYVEGVTGVVTVEDTVLDGLRERVKELALELGELR